MIIQSALEKNEAKLLFPKMEKRHEMKNELRIKSDALQATRKRK